MLAPLAQLLTCLNYIDSVAKKTSWRKRISRGKFEKKNHRQGKFCQFTKTAVVRPTLSLFYTFLNSFNQPKILAPYFSFSRTYFK